MRPIYQFLILVLLLPLLVKAEGGPIDEAPEQSDEISCVAAVLLMDEEVGPVSKDKDNSHKNTSSLSEAEQTGLNSCVDELATQALNFAFQDAIDWDGYRQQITDELDKVEKNFGLYLLNADKVRPLMAAFENRLIQKIYRETQKKLFDKSYELGKEALKAWSHEAHLLRPTLFPKENSFYESMVSKKLAILNFKSSTDNNLPSDVTIKLDQDQRYLKKLVMRSITEEVKTAMKDLIGKKWSENDESQSNPNSDPNQNPMVQQAQ